MVYYQFVSVVSLTVNLTSNLSFDRALGLIGQCSENSLRTSFRHRSLCEINSVCVNYINTLHLILHEHVL